MAGELALRLSEITDPRDERLRQLSQLMDEVFADPNSVLGLDRLQQFLGENRPGAPRRFCILVAEQDATVVGGCVFSYVVASNCGFSEYMLADQRVRGQGLGRKFFEARKEVLDAEAQKHGYNACWGLFIEVDSPDRTPEDYLEAERKSALDAQERLRMFAHLGFLHVDAPYVQPPLDRDKEAVYYLDLLFVPWQPDAIDQKQIPSRWIFNTVEAIWCAWSRETVAVHLEWLKHRITSNEVALVTP